MKMSKVKQKMPKSRLKPKIKFAFYLVLFLILSAVFYFVTYTMFIKINNDKNTFVMNYSNDISLNYEVCILDNPYYLDKCLPMDKQYPHSIIDNIKYNISNTLISSKTTEIKYSYEVVAYLISETTSRDVPKEELWNKKYILVPEVSKKEITNKIDINQDFDINYNYYEKIMESYRQTFQIDMSSYLKIEYHLKLENKKEKINEKIVVSSYIPLLEPIVKISNTIPNNINKNIFVDKTNINNYYHLIILDIIIALLSIILLFKSSKIKFAVDLDGKVNKLIKLYEESIIVVKELPRKDNLEVVTVKTFDDLLDLEQSLKIPIMYFDKNENEKIFAIFSDKYMYQKKFVYKNNGKRS